MRDLLGLVERLARRLPKGLTTTRDLLAAEVGGALYALRVLRAGGVSIPILAGWQQALVD